MSLATDLCINMYTRTSKMGYDVVPNNPNYVIVVFQFDDVLLDVFLVYKP